MASREKPVSFIDSIRSHKIGLQVQAISLAALQEEQDLPREECRES
jgi:hypothetical protein